MDLAMVDSLACMTAWMRFRFVVLIAPCGSVVCSTFLLLVECPREATVHRKEVYEAIHGVEERSPFETDIFP